MTRFLSEDFLLESAVAVGPLPPLRRGPARSSTTTATCRPSRWRPTIGSASITEIWLDGDHYKWRAMRANGVAERFCTGDASDWEKFEAWARTVPDTLRNPLYHWTHMELRRPFGVDDLLSPATARGVFDRCNERLQEDGFTTLGLLRRLPRGGRLHDRRPGRLRSTRTTSAWRSGPIPTRASIRPGGRTGRSRSRTRRRSTRGSAAWSRRRAWRSAGGSRRCSTRSRPATTSSTTMGCRASDHGLETMCAEPWTAAELDAAFDRAPRGAGAWTPAGALELKSALLLRAGAASITRAAGCSSSTSARCATTTRGCAARSGPTPGFDSIGDFEIARPLSRFLDRLDETNQLAKTILYNLNPRDNALLATMIGNFQDGTRARARCSTARPGGSSISSTA